METPYLKERIKFLKTRIKNGFVRTDMLERCKNELQEMMELEQLALHNVSERTFIVEEKIPGSCYWESLSVEFDNLEEAKRFFNRHYEKYSENIRLVEVYAR